MGRWLTPDAEPTAIACRFLRIPLDPTWLGPVTGALLALTYPWQWELHGVTTPEEAAARFSQMLNEFQDAGLNNCMIGMVFQYATTSPPASALPCDGATYLRVDYPNLYASLNAAFIVDADNFVVPDMRSRSPIGAGQGAGLSNYAVNAGGGQENHTLNVGEIPAHSHGLFEIANVALTGVVPVLSPNIVSILRGTDNTGGNASHNTLHPYRALPFAIWAK